MKTRWLLVPLLFVTVQPSFARGQSTERGAAVGGIGGALAGAAIGKHNGDTAAGALIGGAVGLVTGATLGSAADERRYRAAENQYQQAVENERNYRYSRAVSAIDVVSMSQSGVGEDLIINHIRENGIQRRPDVGEVISLHRQGVSERVISAMQMAPEGGRAPAPAVASPPTVYRPAPVVVEEVYYAPPPPYYYPHHHHYYHHRYACPPPRSHVSWGISVSH